MGYKLSKKEKRLLSLFLIFLISYLYLSLYLFPIHKEIRKVKDEMKKYNKMSVENLNLKESLKYDKIKKIPYDQKTSEIAYNIKVYADKCDIKLLTISFGESGTLNNSKFVIKYVPIHISFTGNNNSKIKYLKMIEDDKRVCEINDISTNYSEDIDSVAYANIKYYYIGGN